MSLSGSLPVPAKFTPKLIAVALFTALVYVIVGYDALSFGGLQAIPGFGKHFGVFDKTLNRYALPAATSSLLTSIASVGKITGTIVSQSCTERYGHRAGIILICMATIIGTIIQITAKKTAQFIVGRIIDYLGMGLAQNVIPTYLSEIAPANARGFFVSTVQLFLVVGGLVAAGVNRFYGTFQTSQGWIVPVSVQFITPTIVLCGIMFIPQSPRWLIYKGRRDEAARILESIRPVADVQAGLCIQEVNAIEESLQQRFEKRPWIDLFRGTNLRRTSIAAITFIYQQLTGQAFISTYGTVFYIHAGLASTAFNYNIISTGLGIFACLTAMLLSEYLGRRPILVAGGFFQAFWLYLVAGTGSLSHPSAASKNMMVAATILFNLSYAASSYVVTAEMSTWSLRQKTMTFSSFLNDITVFVMTFTMPYLLNPPFANLQAKVGYIYGSIALSAMFYTLYFVPETKGRSLEELDELFERKPKLPAWRFGGYQSNGIGARITALENMDAGDVSVIDVNDATGSERVHEVNKEELGKPEIL